MNKLIEAVITDGRTGQTRRIVFYTGQECCEYLNIYHCRATDHVKIKLIDNDDETAIYNFTVE